MSPLSSIAFICIHMFFSVNLYIGGIISWWYYSTSGRCANFQQFAHMCMLKGARTKDPNSQDS